MDSLTAQKNDIHELLAFTVGRRDFSVDIRNTQGIHRYTSPTRVYRAASCVRGIINLRGQVVTVLDLSVKLGGKFSTIHPKSRIIIVREHKEDIGLLVDSIIDVIQVENGSVEAPPANLGGLLGTLFSGVYREENTSIGILDVAAIITTDIAGNLPGT